MKAYQHLSKFKTPTTLAWQADDDELYLSQSLIAPDNAMCLKDIQELLELGLIDLKWEILDNAVCVLAVTVETLSVREMVARVNELA
jgi:hypothetical protein